ncbi:hypothetical protein EDD17DRAFT_25386 [Pisolithus thermaeus]|nr:hypothetical protein EDD17DRAFT_25386 [Pisolithus thermaeus]
MKGSDRPDLDVSEGELHDVNRPDSLVENRGGETSYGQFVGDPMQGTPDTPLVYLILFQSHGVVPSDRAFITPNFAIDYLSRLGPCHRPLHLRCQENGSFNPYLFPSKIGSSVVCQDKAELLRTYSCSVPQKRGMPENNITPERTAGSLDDYRSGYAWLMQCSRILHLSSAYFAPGDRRPARLLLERGSKLISTLSIAASVLVQTCLPVCMIHTSVYAIVLLVYVWLGKGEPRMVQRSATSILCLMQVQYLRLMGAQ